ncbi:transmembrane protein, putative (macronuclear) [Tetrahymena thermophila SB210]|uniref:Transmembrane protein, putative n=1 Tax=Tetrahymena thermophila (strain SB210) TaxID=312017 RepID=Q23LQ5_TETTS|nr:transmembrane protein, putative [Tetrahymena thermophila SB210]EAR97455.1 transmembrane protein, putative [Tetrahymena thermophila SB210]|eukprot:XP_001017700.1 transmembrane protein, putative [Tetrahymena thermophila SB210]
MFIEQQLIKIEISVKTKEMKKLLFLAPLLFLLGTGIFLIQGNKTSLLDDDSVTFTQFGDCKSKSVIAAPCMDENETQIVTSSFLMYLGQLEECQEFYEYVNSVQESKDYDHALINKDQLFEKCYASEKIRNLANTNECFFTKYYAPRFLLCGGIEKYAYPPYTTFDIKQ